MKYLFVILVLLFAAPAWADDGCKGVPLNDTDDLLSLAAQGDARAEYILGKLSAKREQLYHDRYGAFQPDRARLPLDDAKARDWWQKAAEHGDPYAQTKIGMMHIEAGETEKGLHWLRKATAQGYGESAAFLSFLYSKGLGVTQNYGEAYFWAAFGRAGHMMEEVASKLTPEDKAALDEKVAAWQAEKPEWKAVPMALNVKGLLCGGQARRCKLMDTCEGLAAIACKDESEQYYMIDSKTHETVSSCTLSASANSCEKFVPEAWTCGQPKNMPLTGQNSRRYKKNHAKQYGWAAVICGDVYGVDVSAKGDGPYYFIDRISGDKLERCSTWTGPCTPPSLWGCAAPSNYGR